MHKSNKWRFSTTQFQHDSTRFQERPFPLQKRYLLNVGGVVIATAPRYCRDLVFYATQTQKQRRTWRLWCTCCCMRLSVTHKATTLSRMTVSLLPVFKNGGFDSCVGLVFFSCLPSFLSSFLPFFCLSFLPCFHRGDGVLAAVCGFHSWRRINT